LVLNATELNELQDLRKKVALQNQFTFELQEKISNYNLELSAKDTQIEWLSRQLVLLKNYKYGRRSEQIPGQLGFFNEAESELEAGQKAALPGVDEGRDATDLKKARLRGTPKRRPIPENLPRREVIVELPESERVCGSDGTVLSEIGREVSEKLNVIPATIEVVRTVRIKYGCARCKEGVRTAPLPAHILPKGLADVGLLSLIVVSKFVDALPLYRNEDILARIGVEIPRCTMAGWVVELGKKLMVLRNLLREELQNCDYICADETPVLVLDNRDKKDPTSRPKRGYMWVYGRAGEDPIVLYDYHDGRGSAAVKQMLEGFTGYLQVDAYGAYDVLCGEGKATRVGCWAHARRKFFESWTVLKKPKRGLAFSALEQIARLYKVEDEIRKLGPSERYRIRQAKSAVILTEIRSWLDASLNVCLPNSDTGKALGYLHNNWERLTVFLQDGQLEVDNNFLENKIRPFAVGRKNWLFSASTQGAESSAVLYSLIETAKANGLDVYNYIHWLLTNFPKATTVEEFEQLLPHRAKKLLIPDIA
jgi:transposase